MLRVAAAGVATLCLPCGTAAAAPGALGGASLHLGWGAPFAGLLLSIALAPLLAPRLWHHHFGKIAAFWAATFLLPFGARFGFEAALGAVLHVLLLDYLPFILLLFALFVVAGGIRLTGNLAATPAANATVLGFGTFAASVLGTTGAAMLLIRPLIRANERRRHKTHIFVFFIFLVANIGGALTPLGDPPLFLGFLQGVGFAWTLQNMLGPMLFSTAVLLALFYAIDRRAWRRETDAMPPRGSMTLRVEGAHNFLLLAGIVAAVLQSGLWHSATGLTVGHIRVPLEGLIRDGTLIILAAISWWTTAKPIRIENAFTWTPIQEVAALFAAIFLTMIPVLAILQAGADGAFAPVIALVSDANGAPRNAAYFWLTGLLSSFLDNAPTYLVFFNVAGGDPDTLMGALATTLRAISAGAVFFGAATYIGNAPNFMVQSICRERGVAMPSFFGYMLWSGAILLPLFGLITLIFFAG